MTTMSIPTPGSARRAARVRTRLTRRGRVVLAALLLLPLITGAGVLAGGITAAAGDDTVATSFHYLTVHEGDSLWSIAERVAPHADPRDVIRAIIDLNALPSSSVDTGERLAIPHAYDSVAGR